MSEVGYMAHRQKVLHTPVVRNLPILGNVDNVAENCNENRKISCLNL